jgi:outer membrane protein assembly factor BamD
MPSIRARSAPAALLRLLALLFLIGGLAGCGVLGSRDDLEQLGAEELYASGRSSMENGAFERAERVFKAVNSRFPFGSTSEKAQLALAYAQYRQSKHDEAQATVDRFIRTYPTHPRVDYAHYLRGLINFERDASFINSLVATDASKRDQTSHRQSFRDFGELVKRFPESQYAPDARARMVYLRNTMAQSELDVARYYLRRGAWVGAANRARYLLDNYQGAPQTHDALAILVQSYRELGETELANDSLAVLKLNAPQHPFLTGAPIEEQGFLQKLWPFGKSDVAP